MVEIGVPCKNCYDSPELLCGLCESKLDVCANCVFHGRNVMCANCSEEDEAVNFDYDVNAMYQWIIWNTNYWL
jgi:hypothetical protein